MNNLIKFDAGLLHEPTNMSRVLVNYWWAIDNDGNAMIHQRSKAAQANPHKELLERVYPDYEHRLIPVAYLDIEKIERAVIAKSYGASNE